MLIPCFIVFSAYFNLVLSYNNRLFTLTNYEHDSGVELCALNNRNGSARDVFKIKVQTMLGVTLPNSGQMFSYVTLSNTTPKPTDPLIEFEQAFRDVLYGAKAAANRLDLFQLDTPPKTKDVENDLTHWPSGQIMRAETFQGKAAVHLPFVEYMHRGLCKLKVTKDHMQTAVDAFAIFTYGDLSDVARLPGSYVLNSARTIAMMRLTREKFAATWQAVKGSLKPEEVTYETLEKFRPLFKYINGREMARLNLSDTRILTFIGTHPDLNRHQVGVVASRYIELNPHWNKAKYLNVMNNLICGVRMIFMRRIPESTYLQLTHQVFYHIRGCDPLQRQFYLAMMMRPQVLGKSYSWNARDVSRLGLLLAEVSGPDLSAINPEAMSGITAQVMSEMPIHRLTSLTEMQLRYLEPRPLNILARKLIDYQAQQLAASNPAARHLRPPTLLLVCILYANILEII